MFKFATLSIASLFFIAAFAPVLPAQPMTEKTPLNALDAEAEDNFGLSIAISGDVAVVGAWQDDDNGADSGAAYIFERNAGAPDGWGQTAKLVADDGEAGDAFGYRVAVSGDVVIVGAYLEDSDGSDAGSAYIFERDQVDPALWVQKKKLVGADTATGDLFGGAVSISGDVVVVGAQANQYGFTDRGEGAAYIFERDQDAPGAWGQVVKLIADDGQGGDLFGCSVSINGDVVVVGARNDDAKGPDSGSAYVFERDEGSPGAWGQAAKCTASDGAADDYFGHSVAVNNDLIIVGAYGHDGVQADAGAAYLFDRNEGEVGAWGEVIMLTDSNAGADDRFGISVALAGDVAAVGAPLADDQGDDAGAFYTFERNQDGPGNWGEASRQSAAETSTGDQFGCSVAMDGLYLAVGALDSDSGGVDAGSAYIFESSGGPPPSDPEITIPTAFGANFGETASVPIMLYDNDSGVAGVAFSIDFDESCLDFDPADNDGDDIPDAIHFDLPANFGQNIYIDLSDGDGEIDVVITDESLLIPFNEVKLCTVDFTTTCEPAPGETIIAPVLFSADPVASFGNLSGQSLSGSTVDGSVEIHSGIRGDCNNDGVVNVADVISCELELTDGDDPDWLAAPGGTFPGNPVGCDSNADAVIDAGDLSCTSMLIFGLTCPDPGGRRSATRPPRLELAPRLDQVQEGVVAAQIHFTPGDHEINSMVFSLDFDPEVLRFDPADNDGDWTPDAVHFPGARTSRRTVRFDPDDHSSELDFIIADLVRHPMIIEKGVLVEIEFLLLGRPDQLDDAISFSTKTEASFGNRSGRGVPGAVYVDRPKCYDQNEERKFGNSGNR